MSHRKIGSESYLLVPHTSSKGHSICKCVVNIQPIF
ncbi:hypothetical protein VPHK406_0258 [Vibrio phage K406]